MPKSPDESSPKSVKGPDTFSRQTDLLINEHLGSILRVEEDNGALQPGAHFTTAGTAAQESVALASGGQPV